MPAYFLLIHFINMALWGKRHTFCRGCGYILPNWPPERWYRFTLTAASLSLFFFFLSSWWGGGKYRRPLRWAVPHCHTPLSAQLFSRPQGPHWPWMQLAAGVGVGCGQAMAPGLWGHLLCRELRRGSARLPGLCSFAKSWAGREERMRRGCKGRGSPPLPPWKLRGRRAAPWASQGGSRRIGRT